MYFERLIKLVRLSGCADLSSQICKDIYLKQMGYDELRVSLEEKNKMYTSALEMMNNFPPLKLDKAYPVKLNSLVASLAKGYNLSSDELQLARETVEAYLKAYLDEAAMVREQS